MRVPLRVDEFLIRAITAYGAKLAVVDGERRLTYAELAARSYALARALQGLGVSRGDRVGLVSPNSHTSLEAFWACAALGAVIVPLNFRLARDDFAYCLGHAEARVVLADIELTSTLEGLDIEHRVAGRPHHPDLPIPAGWLDWEALIESYPADPLPDCGADEDDLVSLNYTSGTTARPKGVMLTHRNFVINAYNYLAHFGVTDQDVYLWTLPMFHCNGWGGVYALTAVGATQVIVRYPNPAEVFRAVEAEAVTLACMAPVVLARLLDDPTVRRYQFQTRPLIVCAGAPPPAAHIERLESELGWRFLQIYGLTETSPIITVSHTRPHLCSFGSLRWKLLARAGFPALGADIRVFSGPNQEVPADDYTVGEVAVRGNMVFAGYWRQPEETARVVRDGYFFTGDLATRDATGCINLVDRAKDVIISGGENISSIEVEEGLYGHPAVAEAAVIGVPHEHWGETPLAFVVVREGHNLDPEQLRAFLRERMAHFKVPTAFEMVAALPRTATGKLKKFELREPYWRGQARRVH